MLLNVNLVKLKMTLKLTSHPVHCSSHLQFLFFPLEPKQPSPPTIFIQGVTNFKAMLDQIFSVIDKENVITQALANNVVKVNVGSSDDYRKLIHNLRSHNIALYTYQMKNERSFKVVIRHLHDSVDPTDIKIALGQLGYEVRNVVNVHHWRTKDPLPLFFVDIEPNVNNKSIYEIKSLLHARIQVEAPRPRNDPIQCKRCQRYGHTKAYCTLPFVCVECGVTTILANMLSLRRCHQNVVIVAEIIQQIIVAVPSVKHTLKIIPRFQKFDQ